MVCSPARAARVSVLHVLVPAPVGGLEAVVTALTLGARGSPVEAKVAAVLPSGQLDHPFLAPLRDAGVELHPIEVPRRGYLQERTRVAQLCLRLGPDVVHTHGYRADVLDAPGARRLGIPVVTTVHGFTGGDRKNSVYEWLQRRAFRKFDAVVAVSRALRDDLAKSGVPRERLYFVPNAYHPSEPPLNREAACRALRLTPNGFRVGWVGRLSAEKGPDVLVEALRRLEDVPLTVSFVGTGPLRPALEDRVQALQLADRIRWHGLVPGAGRLLRAFEAFALTSRTEGIPMTLLEAMAAEVPIIAASVGGVPDVISSQEALLVPPEDPQAVAAALRQVFHDPAAARRRARAARERLERELGVAAWLGRYEAVYRAVRRSSESRAR
jgi:glycosyltransferase involved in cell wall biosynthesis